VLRTHNIEHNYYRYLADSTNQFFKRLFYKIESRKLKRYESKILPVAQKVLAISEADKRFFEKLNPQTEVLLPSIDFEQKTVVRQTDEKFILFHGNLSVEENEKAALFLIAEVFTKIDFPVVIAGKSPSVRLQKAITPLTNVSLIVSPNEKEMETLIASAHIHLLYSFQDTGVKLKLINVLQNGKFCITNDAIVRSLPVKKMLILANSPEEILSVVKELMDKQFDKSQQERRKLFLSTVKQKNEMVLMSVFMDEQ
ncbi:MAG: glycosyltransferase, partial [Bacteroidales bacterium]|nr:glycosyltransferase [Bacteroidales bacterium]